MISEYRIAPECSSDTLLIKFVRGLPKHYFGIGSVFKRIEEDKQPATPIIGIVDDDKFVKKLEFIQDFKEIRREQGLRLMRKSSTNQYLIFVCPAFEQWIWRCAEIAEVDSSRWGYLEWRHLTKHSKAMSIDTLHEPYKNYVNAIVQANPQPITTLRNWLNEILGHPI